MRNEKDAESDLLLRYLVVREITILPHEVGQQFS